jgi:hypothetical protein
VYYRSAPDSGYSVDNLSPPMPAPFAAIYGPYETALHWGTSSAPDLREFRLYRGLTPDFIPDASNLLVATRDTGYVDPDQRAYAYKLAAVDLHGNVSRYALVTPNGPIAVLASLSRIVASADQIRVTWFAAANPGLVATVYRRTESSAWVSVASLVADAQGYLPYVDTDVETGQRYGYRLGIMDGDNEVFAGEAWATAGVQQVFALEGVRPNPAVGGDLTVFFSLPGSGAARLELLDVSGRRMAAREVGSLGPGPHSMNLASSATLAPGIYLVRLTQGEKTLVSRAAVLK